MPDTFRAQLYCRNSDIELFEESGFEVEGVEIPDYPYCVLMVDNLATITQIADLPTDVPYFGSTSAAYEFDATRFACDSQTFLEHNVSNGDDACFVVRFDENGDPVPDELDDIKKYIQHEKRAMHILQTLTPSPNASIKRQLPNA